MQVANDPVTLISRAMPISERVVSAIESERMSDATSCPDWDVRALVEHFTMTLGASASAVSGAPSIAAADDVKVANREAAQAAAAAMRQPGALEKTYQMPWGETPGPILASLLFMETMIHTWDLAKATGQDTNLDPELCEAALAMGREMLPAEVRNPEQGFGPEVTVAADAPICDRFAAFFGRRP